jgi:hypothetical protein
VCLWGGAKVAGFELPAADVLVDDRMTHCNGVSQECFVDFSVALLYWL